MILRVSLTMNLGGTCNCGRTIPTHWVVVLSFLTLIGIALTLYIGYFRDKDGAPGGK